MTILCLRTFISHCLHIVLVFTCVHTLINTLTHVHMFAYTQMHPLSHTCTYMYVFMRARTHAHTHNTHTTHNTQHIHTHHTHTTHHIHNTHTHTQHTHTLIGEGLSSHGIRLLPFTTRPLTKLIRLAPNRNCVREVKVGKRTLQAERTGDG